MSNNKQNMYSVPGAIVVAGILIAGAVIYVNRTPSSGETPETTGGCEEVVSPVEVAKAIGLNTRNFQKCMDEGRYAADVSADSQEATAAGGTGTPFSVVISSGGIKYPVFGAFPMEQMRKIIDGALAEDTAMLQSLEAQFGASVGEIRPIGGEDHVLGNADAPVELVLFSDMQCPFCKQFHATLKQIESEYGDQVVIAFRHLPLEQRHPNAKPLAEGSECAAELGGNDAFWAYLDEVF